MMNIPYRKVGKCRKVKRKKERASTPEGMIVSLVAHFFLIFIGIYISLYICI